MVFLLILYPVTPCDRLSCSSSHPLIRTISIPSSYPPLNILHYSFLSHLSQLYQSSYSFHFVPSPSFPTLFSPHPSLSLSLSIYIYMYLPFALIMFIILSFIRRATLNFFISPLPSLTLTLSMSSLLSLLHLLPCLSLFSPSPTSYLHIGFSSDLFS